MTRARATALAVPILLAVASGSATTAQSESAESREAAPPWPLLFNARVEGESRIYRLDAPGAEPVALGGGSGRDNQPVPSPDGSKIAFQSQRDGNYEIYVVDRDGTEATNLTRSPEFDGLPVWSPDGERIAFFSRRDVDEGTEGQFPGHLYVMRSDGGEPERLPVAALGTTLGPSDWSPDGRSLLLTRQVDGQFDLFELSLDDWTETRLTDDPAVEGSATFSPDGSRIAFYAEGEGRADIVILEVPTGARRVLTASGGHHYYPAWSPDGAWITTTSLGEGDQYDILLWAADGSSQEALVATPKDERESVWLPGG